ncbi:phosphate signaling complex protein PhoU [Kangiella sediminilitoris]|uniref:Phosphate-specific transport system accessory protein PhoU n=1 Tax=Kangiella sediminilitoris TaxID=1144748 RepID=A0A1B3B8V9_9GAMM|nr:phosphate signaling complex protein PhoU [Kangiella sediminilitoris]AOE49210.1 transcriptional regulator PhoU [Kangiella sediminilitoris]
MDNENLSQHISKQFNQDLENVREEVLAMGGLVEEQLTKALEALSSQDIKLAKEVIETDDRVNDFEINIDEACVKILAKRQPAASDLRLVSTVLKTITDLERVGDEAEKIARMAVEIAEAKEESPLSGKLHFGSLQHLGGLVKSMLHDALDSFARMDTESAVKVAKKDKDADKEYDAISRELMTYMMEEPRNISQVLDFMWAARSLERIGDHAHNICEYIVYLVRGQDVRHLSWDEIHRLVKNRN